MRFALTLACVTLLAGCTPGASALSSGPGPGALPPQTLTIDVNLTLHSNVTNLPQGAALGFAPATTTVPVGSTIRFVNSDGFAHTASVLSGTTFANAAPLPSSALSQSGARISDTWSSGLLNAAQGSQVITADTPGTYLYGCFIHNSMRGVIIVQ